MFERLKSLFKRPEFWVILLLFLSLGVVYRNVLLKGYVAFPSNFLASFYSPWSTQRFEGYPNGVPHKPIGGNDQVRMFYPYRTFVNESIARGELPLWNPYNFSGSPILANFQSSIFYPLNFVYFVLPQIDAWTVLGVIQPILGTLFMYLYLRVFITRKLAAFFGAFSFGFSGFILTWSQENAVVGHSVLWLPLILYFIEKLLVRPSHRLYVLLVFSIFSCSFAGHHQFSLQALGLTFAYSLYRLYEINKLKNWQVVGMFISAYMLAVVIGSIQLLPTLEAFSLSPRSSTSSVSVVNEYLVPVTHFIQAIVPDIFGTPGSYNYFGKGFYQERVFYLGTIALVFALLIIKKWREISLVRFFVVTAGITYLLASDNPVSRLVFQLPIISTFTPSRFLTLTSSALSVLAGFGFAYWLEERDLTKKTLLWIAGSMVGITVITLAFLYVTAQTNNPLLLQIFGYMVRPVELLEMKNVNVAIRNAIIPLVMLGLLGLLVLIQSRLVFAAQLVVLVLCLGQLYFLNKYLVLGERKFLYPEHFVLSEIRNNQQSYERFLTFGSPILGNVGLDKHLYSPDGIDPVFPARYGQLVFATKNEGLFTKNIPRIEANLSEYRDNLNIRKNPYRVRLMSLLGVTRVYNYEPSYIGQKDFQEIFPAGQFEPLWNRDGWQAYQNTAALPRAFLVPNFVIETDSQKSIDLILKDDIDLRRTVVLEEKPTDYPLETRDSVVSSLIIEKYSPQEVSFKVTTASPQILFLSDNFYPGWAAEVDNKPTKIYRANYTFRAVVVPEGTHTIVYKFKPKSVKYGLWISIGGLVVLLGILSWPSLKKARPV